MIHKNSMEFDEWKHEEKKFYLIFSFASNHVIRFLVPIKSISFPYLVKTTTIFFLAFFNLQINRKPFIAKKNHARIAQAHTLSCIINYKFIDHLISMKRIFFFFSKKRLDKTNFDLCAISIASNFFFYLIWSTSIRKYSSIFMLNMIIVIIVLWERCQ